MNSKDLLYHAGKALDFVTKRYAERGVQAVNKPSIVYLNRTPPEHTDAEAFVKSEINNQDYTVCEVLNHLIKSMLEPMIGLSLSNEAFNELINSKTSKDVPIPLTKLEDNTIYLLSPARRLSVPDLHVDIAHELWHLIEIEHGLSSQAVLINEGTATYASYFMFRKSFDETIIQGFNKFKDFSFLLRDGCANVIQEIIKNEPKPLQTLLDPYVRLCIQDEFLTQAGKASVNLLNDKSLMKRLRYSMNQSSELIDLYTNPTSDKIIDYYARQGALVLAGELASQDLSGLINFYKRIIL